MTSKANILQSDLERAIRAAKKAGVLLIVEPRTGRMIFDPNPEPRIAVSQDDDEGPNPWEEGIRDATS